MTDNFILDNEELAVLRLIILRNLYSIVKRMLYDKNIKDLKFTPENEILCGFEIFFPCLENGDIHPIEKVFIGLKFQPEDTFMQDDLNYVTGNWVFRPFGNILSKYFSPYQKEEYYLYITKDFKKFDINGLVEETLNLYNTPYLPKEQYTKWKDNYENEEI